MTSWRAIPADLRSEALCAPMLTHDPFGLLAPVVDSCPWRGAVLPALVKRGGPLVTAGTCAPLRRGVRFGLLFVLVDMSRCVSRPWCRRVG